MDKAKPFNISKHQVWRAYEKVKANRGSAGIDKQSLEDFEAKLKDNLYKIWNRLSSGSYMPPPVRGVSIPKKDGGKRVLGIPTVGDRIAQMVVKLELEPSVEPWFHEDSYGYRPGKSAHQAVDRCRRRCWRMPWVVDIDIQGFFDNIDHDLLLRAVRRHTKTRWVLLYIERWLKSEIVGEDGKTAKRLKGTPQGGVISPLLANLFLHYAFDVWMSQQYPELVFERYADDIIVHCRYRQQAHSVKMAIQRRLGVCKLRLHPEKTKIVFCRNYLKGKCEGYLESFDFLGFTFRQRCAKGPTGNLYDGFLPAISKKAKVEIQRRIRFWHVGRKSDRSIQELSEMYNPILRGWVNYYGRFYPQAMRAIREQWYRVLTRWAKRKYKRFRNHFGPAGRWIYNIERRDPKLFALWQLFHSGS